MPVVEPTLAALPNPALRYFLATRPPFLGVTLFACLIGLATAFSTGLSIRPATAIVTVVFALAVATTKGSSSTHATCPSPAYFNSPSCPVPTFPPRALPHARTGRTPLSVSHRPYPPRPRNL